MALVCIQEEKEEEGNLGDLRGFRIKKKIQTQPRLVVGNKIVLLIVMLLWGR